MVDDPRHRSTEVLREEAAAAARALAKAHEQGDLDQFHFRLGEMAVLAKLIYDGNLREGRA